MGHLASYSKNVVNLFYLRLFVCLFLHRFIKSFKGIFLATFLEIRYQHWRYGEVGSVSFLDEEAEN